MNKIQKIYHLSIQLFFYLKKFMSFVLPNWIPHDPSLLESCINEEMNRLNELQEEISKLESKSFNPFIFKSPNPDIKLPSPMTMKLLNTLIYKTKIVDYDYSYSIRQTQPPTIYIATAHEIHYFQAPIIKNNPPIKIPISDTEIKSIAIFSEMIIVLFTNNNICPYSLIEKTWKPPIQIGYTQPINFMKRIKNYIFLQTGLNNIFLFDSTNYQLIGSKTLNTKTILDSYFPTDSSDCYFKTIEKEVIVVDIESMRIIRTVSLADIFIYKLAIQSYGNFLFAYNDEITVQYDRTFKIAAQLDFGSTYMYAESDLIFFLSETNKSQFQNENDSQNANQTENQTQSNNKHHAEEDNYSEEEEDNDAIISLSIASIKTKEILATLSISKINIVSFKVIFTKLGERRIIIQGDDNSLSFWNFTFGDPQKDDHGSIVIQKIGEEDQKKQLQQYQQQQQQMKQIPYQNHSKVVVNRKASIIPPSAINNQTLTIINAPIQPVNQATSVHLPTTNENHNQFDSNPAQPLQMNHISTPKVRSNQFANNQIINNTKVVHTANNINNNENNNNKTVQIHIFNSISPSQGNPRSPQLNKAQNQQPRLQIPHQNQQPQQIQIQHQTHMQPQLQNSKPPEKK